jgi:transposase
MKDLEEQRVCMKFCFKLGKTFTETFQMLQQAYGEDCLSRTQCYEWYQRLKSGRTSIEDDPKSGRPSSSTGDDHIEKVRSVIRENRRLTVHEVYEEVGVWMLHHDNAPPHASLLIREFLAKQETTVVPQPHYSPDLAPADFFLFPELKSTLKGHRFQTVEEIKENSLQDLCAIPQNTFQDTFQKWRKRWERCINSRGEYFEGDKSD